jgi:hypothetical protein
MNYLQNIQSIFMGSFEGVWGLLSSFSLALLLAVISFVIGVLVASVLGSAIAQVIRATKIDKLFEKAGLEKFMNKIGLKLDIGKFFGTIIKWFIVIIFLMAALQIMGLTEVSEFLGNLVIVYLPKVVVIIIILMLATIISEAFKKIVIAGSKAANLASSEMLGTIAKYAVWVVAIILALGQIDELKSYALIIFIGIVAFIVISSSIAFGIGGKEAATRTIEKISREISSK